MPRVRIGNVSYLNATPLVAGLEADPSIELMARVPSAVAAALALGELDLGLVPIAEAARLGLYVAPGVAVASRGPVRSVLLLHRGPLEAVRSLGLDPASRTSAALSQIVLRDASGVDPKLIAGPEDGDPFPAGADSALIIGDRALRYQAGVDIATIDLGQWWEETQALPFVYAVWAGRDPVLVRALGPRLLEAGTRGLAGLDAIVRREAAPRRLDPAVALHYLEHAIVFDLGELELKGAARFVQLMKQHHLLASDAGFRLVEP